jgi:ribose-phosphate pyrophosphokinase
MFLLYFDDESSTAEALAHSMGIACTPVSRHRFPDGELRLKLPAKLPEQVVILRSLKHPNEKLLELLLCARTARTLGARQVILVAPYLAYMRQDMAFSPGEVVSQRVVGAFLAELFDAVITVDPHLHRVQTLSEAIPLPQAIALSAAPALSDLIAQHHHQPILIGPDTESAQWVAQAAARHGFEHAVCHKTRHGDRDVRITLPAMVFTDRAVVLIDDVASSAQTLIGATRLLQQAGAASVDVAITHALFAGDALEQLQAAGVRHIWSTDCVAHSTNAVSMAQPIAQALRQLKPQQG